MSPCCKPAVVGLRGDRLLLVVARYSSIYGLDWSTGVSGHLVLNFWHVFNSRRFVVRQSNQRETQVSQLVRGKITSQHLSKFFFDPPQMLIGET